MGKEKIRLEYMLKAGSGNIVWSIISTPSGLETWFADKVTFKDKVFTFYWGKTETRQAEVTNFRVNSFIRFRWLDDEDPKAYFELKMVYNELTSDYMLEVIDWAEPDKVDWSTWDLRMRNAYIIAKEYCDKNNIRIINASRGGNLDVFERKELELIVKGEK